MTIVHTCSTIELDISFITPFVSTKGPVRLEVEPTSSTALKAKWLPPLNHERGSVVYDVRCSLVHDEDDQVPVKRNETFSGLSRTNLMLTSLLPYKVYVVIVTARNEEGSSHPQIMQARTFSAGK